MSILEQLVEDMQGEKFSLTEAGIIMLFEKIPTMNFSIDAIRRIRSKVGRLDSKLNYLIKIELCEKYVKWARDIINLEDGATEIKNLEKGQKYVFFDKSGDFNRVDLIVIDIVTLYDIFFSKIYHQDLYENFGGRIYGQTKLNDICNEVNNDYIFYKVISYKN